MIARKYYHLDVSQLQLLLQKQLAALPKNGKKDTKMESAIRETRKEIELRTKGRGQKPPGQVDRVEVYAT